MSNTEFKDGENRLQHIVAPLLSWYDANARELPWRLNTDPYRVWVSEIMLQQTQVNTVIAYYNRFMAQIPDVAALARIEEEQLLKLWEGLGYYSRARNLQKSARIIMTEYAGRFPQNFDAIRALPGIGDYTAGAISSISFNKPIPAVDGNVLRVMARFTDSTEDIAAPAVKKRFSALLAKIYPADRCGDFTQSLMELGATICQPKRMPQCLACPLMDLCCAYKDGTQSVLPVKAKKQLRRKEDKTVFLLCCGEKIAVTRRADNVLLAGMWEFPNISENMSLAQAKEQLERWEIDATKITAGVNKKHVFTHVEWQMCSYIVLCERENPEFLWVTRTALEEEIALPSAFSTFLKQI